MGLDTTHGCWHGPYSAFGEFRSSLFDAAFGGGIRETYAYLREANAWTDDDSRRQDPIMVLLMHSDWDGSIPVEHAEELAGRLDELADILPDGHAYDARQFARGLRTAAALGEDVEFQ